MSGLRHRRRRAGITIMNYLDAWQVPSDRAFADLGLELLLFSVQSPTNIGMIMRVAEAYCFAVSIFDPHHVVDDPEKVKTIEDFSCGSLRRRRFVRLANEKAIWQRCEGRRLIATSMFPGANGLVNFRFRAGDIVILGNEYDGLPDDLVAKADLSLRIAMPHLQTPKPVSWYPIDPTRNSVSHDGTPSLNVAISAGIICHAVYTNWLATEAELGQGRE
jgi:tRNA (cytidine/uridine-2'-O-)-methyltransferase